MRKILSFVIVVLFLSGCEQSGRPIIGISENCGKTEMYAAKEIRKYIYLRTGELLKIEKPSVAENFGGIDLKVDGSLSNEEFRLKTENGVLTISGGTEQAVLYGAYELAEQFGIRFYLHGDVVPDKQIPFLIPKLDIRKKPLFSIRGIQPFHDFPEGPDWWNQVDYKSIVTQLPKLKMNFLGFHTYPERENFNGEGHKAEPMVWIGTEDQINADGTIKSAYPVLHFNTMDESWGYFSKPTSTFSFGTSQLFDHEKYGPEYMVHTSSWPHLVDENVKIFNDFGALQNDVFSYANSLGVKICIGTETSLTIPKNVKNHLKSMGVNPESDEAKKMVYKGIFERIKKTHPLDYYWFWTPEDWTWSAVKKEVTDKTERDLQLAIEAGKEASVPFKFATCGWVLGPPPDRARFDNSLPKEMPFSCINRNVGFEEIDTTFIRISNREKWAIPWMEDDPALVVPQLWVGRMRRDAADARAYGCSGLIGIHWRTLELGPNVSALAQAAWDQSGWNPTTQMNVSLKNIQEYKKLVSGEKLDQRDLETNDFYLDWAKSQFGGTKAEEIASVFRSIDGGLKTPFSGKKETNLPRPVDWDHGPGGLVPNKTSWEEVGKKYAFIDKLESIRPLILGAGNLERFDYWLNEFRYLKAIGKLTCIMGRYNLQAEKLKTLTPANQKSFAEQNLLPVRIEEMKVLAEIHSFLVQLATTKGTMGNIANWQLHIIPLYFEKQEKELSLLLGRKLEDSELPPKVSEMKIINVLSPPNSLEKGNDFKAEILTMNLNQVEGSIFYRPLGAKLFKSFSVQASGSGVFKAEIPSSEINDDFEYYIEIKTDGKVNKVYPANAPVINNAVVIY